MHVRVRASEPILERLDHAIAGQIEVLKRVRPVREVVAREGVHKSRIDAFAVEDVQQLGQVPRLLIFVADELAFQSDRRCPFPLDDAVPVAPPIGRTTVRTTAELCDRGRLSLSDKIADIAPVAISKLDRPIGGVG